MSDYTLLIGDALEQLRTLPSDSVSCCVTSPPYFGLRDYGTATWEGGDPDCDHVEKFNRNDGDRQGIDGFGGNANAQGHAHMGAKQYRAVCGKCGARRVDQQIGLEATPDAYVARLVEVFREVRRILHPTGVLFLNLGDSYNGSGTMGSMDSKQGTNVGSHAKLATRIPGLKPKDLIGIPWLVAFALRADGWWLRQEIIWHKLAPMPESVTDRCTKAHEQVFLLAKSERYYFDAEAIREPLSESSIERVKHGWKTKRMNVSGSLARGELVETNMSVMGNRFAPEGGRNKRSVWTLGPESYSGAHYAVMPSKLVEPCVLAGSSAHGVCAACLAPYERVVEREATLEAGRKQLGYGTKTDGGGFQRNGHDGSTLHHDVTKTTLGWTATCTCQADVIPATVLDPFAGSGTTLAVALKHGRRAIGIDLDPRNAALVTQRIEQSQPLLLLNV